MSYILDSLKKSEQQRPSMESSTMAAIGAPPFMESKQPSPIHQWLIGLIIVLLIAMAAVVYYFTHDQVKNAPVNSFSNNAIDSVTSTENQQDTIALSEKEKAVELYEKTIQTVKSNDIDTLYSRATKKKPETIDTVVSNTADILEKNQSSEVASANVEKNATVKQEAIIPSVYQLDAVVKRKLPAIEYGAHIYATDNKSGFVILNGARARVGDNLANGVYVEKIEEDNVVLSYEGAVFSLPAMKSWSGE